MVGIKDIEMPCDCWDCELTKETYSGLTICVLTGNALPPMGTMVDRDKNCSLIEIE